MRRRSPTTCCSTFVELTALAPCLVDAAAALAAAFPFGIEVLAGVAAGVAVSLAVAALAVRRLGGITGDVLGALVEVATATCLLATAIR